MTDSTVTIADPKAVAGAIDIAVGRSESASKASKAKPKGKAKGSPKSDSVDTKRDSDLVKSRGKGVTKQINPGDVISTAKYQVRALNNSKVKEYAGLMESGVTFPPIIVHEIDGKPVLVGGYHRRAAAEMAGLSKIKALVYPNSTAEAAYIHAIEDNRDHGIPLKPVERKAAAKALFKGKLTKDFSNAEIGRLMGVTRQTVANWRREAGMTSADPRGGKTSAQKAKAKQREELDTKAREVLDYYSRKISKPGDKPGDSQREKVAVDIARRAEFDHTKAVDRVLDKGEAYALTFLIALADTLVG